MGTFFVYHGVCHLAVAHFALAPLRTYLGQTSRRTHRGATPGGEERIGRPPIRQAPPLQLGAFGFGIQSVCPDLMHIKHLGTDSSLFGSVLQLFYYRVMDGSPADNLQSAWASVLADMKARCSEWNARHSCLLGALASISVSRISANTLNSGRGGGGVVPWSVFTISGCEFGKRAGHGGGRVNMQVPRINQAMCSVHAFSVGPSHRTKAHRVRDRFGNMKLSMITSLASPWSAFPKLKGRASEVRSLGPVLLRLWESNMDQASTVHKQVRLALKAPCVAEDVLAAHKDAVRLPDAAISEIKRTIHAFLTSLTALGAHYVPQCRREAIQHHDQIPLFGTCRRSC